MRIFTTGLILAAGALIAAAPALAVTKQQSPAPGPERSQIADPDEQADRLAERTEHAARSHRYDRTSARSVMELGGTTGPR